MKQFLFSYGTLQKEDVQLKLFGRTLNGSIDVLPNYRVKQVEIQDKTFLAKGEQKQQLTAVHTNDENDLIKGTALEMTEQELLLTDEYEPEGYHRVKVFLISGKEAWLYLLTG